ncbi:MAG: hypothetical protein LBR41_00755, partial [Rickettsiales bacterium]|nr:hypothetical protein [Rickettsiales bacterium]
MLKAMSQQRGAGLLEVLMVLGITAMAAPFIYGRINDTARELGDLSNAKSIYAWRVPVTAFVLENQARFPENSGLDFDDMSVFKNAPDGNVKPIAGYLDKYNTQNNVRLDA